MTNEERKIKYANRNVKMFPVFCALTWDVLFVWTISTLFLTEQKGLSPSELITLNSILMLSAAIMVVPIGKLFQNMKPIVACRIGMLGYLAHCLCLIFGNSYFVFALGYVFLGFGYSVISVKSNSVLTDSLSVVKRDKDYQRVYGKGLSLFYALDSIGAIAITYVYNWKPYLTYWISAAVVVFIILYTFLMVEPSKFQERNAVIDNVQEKNKEKHPDSYFKILTSAFFVMLLLFMFLVRGVTSIASESFKLYLQSAISFGTIPVWAYGYIYAGSRLCNALANNFQFKFNLKFGVRSIVFMVFALIATFLINSLTFLYCSNVYITLAVIVVSSYVLCAIRPVCSVFVNNYMQVCMPKKNIERAYAIRTMVEYIGYALVSAIYAKILTAVNDNYGYSNLIHIAIYAIPLIIVMIVFIRQLCRKHAQKYTIIRSEYTED